MHFHRAGLAIVLGWAAAMSSPLAHAALGGTIDTIQSDAVRMKAQARMIPSAAPAAYIVQEIRLASGTVVHEYANSAGTVFAVIWRGPQMPNLRQALGSYASVLADAEAAHHFGHTHLIVDRPGVHIESNGHMRAFSGIAFAPALVPANISVAQLQ